MLVEVSTEFDHLGIGAALIVKKRLELGQLGELHERSMARSTQLSPEAIKIWLHNRVLLMDGTFTFLLFFTFRF